MTGEAGIGKTRLVESLVSTVTGRTVWGACWNDPGTPAFWPWTTVLRDCSAVLGLELSDDLAPVMGTAAVIPGPSEQLRIRLFESIAAFLCDAASVRPHVIVLEDLHFADEASLDLLRFLASTLRAQPVAILGTYRYPDLEPGRPLQDALPDLVHAARTVSVHGLDQADVGELISATTGNAPSGRLSARVRDRTDGNPLFVTEFARLLGARGDAEHIPIPATVQRVIARRLEQISNEAVDVLAQASVIGQVLGGGADPRHGEAA